MPDKKNNKFTLELIKDRIGSLPVLPSVLCELTGLSRESSDFFEKVAELAKKDPPLAVTILQLANSASSMSSAAVHTIEDALIRLGVFKTLSLITAVSVSEVFGDKQSVHTAIWQHSVETAHFSRFLAEHLPGSIVDKELAYTCGLLHDIGRFIMLQISSKTIEVVDAHGWDTPTELPEVESHLFGFTHADVGAIAAKKWQLSKEIQNVIQYHHRDDVWEVDAVPLEFKQLLTIVQFADSLSVHIIRNPDWPEWTDDELKTRIADVCIHDKWPKLEFPIAELVKKLPTINAEYNE